ncbi:MAG: c-type cytochrome [Phototrophicaceae bacterium]
MRRIWTILGVILGVVVVLAGVAVGVVFALSNQEINTVYDIPPVVAVNIPSDEAAITEGARQYVVRGCVDCHGADGSGGVVVDDPALGQIHAANLTPGEGGVGERYPTSVEWQLAIRHGVHADGTSFWIMPSVDYTTMSETDMGNLIAYLQGLTPVDNVIPASSLGPIGRVLTLDATSGILSAAEIDHSAAEYSTVAVAASVEYGEYLINTCKGCHGENLAGQAIPGFPIPSQNITFDATTGIGGWTFDEFKTAMQTGVQPDGTAINPIMPWAAFAQFSDVELEALYLYLESLPTVVNG